MLGPAIFLCVVTAVYDGDTLTCRDGTRVRLAGVDAPEMGRCRRGRMCVPGDPVRARAALRGLALGQTIRCERAGVSWNRVVAWCSVGGQDLSCAMIRGGTAFRDARYDRN